MNIPDPMRTLCRFATLSFLIAVAALCVSGYCAIWTEPNPLWVLRLAQSAIVTLFWSIPLIFATFDRGANLPARGGTP